jgi:TonB family protein
MSTYRCLAWLAVVASLVSGTVRVAASVHATAEQVRQWAVFTPKPRYPDEARRRKVSGSGLYKLRVTIKTGRVKQILILRSAGSKDLDKSAVQTLSQWQFRPGALPSIRQLDRKTKEAHADEEALVGIPVVFTLP